MKIAYAILLVAFSAPIAAQDADPLTKTESEEVAPESATVAEKDKEPERQTAEPSPESARLKSRSVGAAMGRFRPSEEISADNAVPFPVDI